jgi:hypothetical protein
LYIDNPLIEDNKFVQEKVKKHLHALKYQDRKICNLYIGNIFQLYQAIERNNGAEFKLFFD